MLVEHKTQMLADKLKEKRRDIGLPVQRARKFSET